MSEAQAIGILADKLLKTRGLDGLSPEAYEEFRADLVERIETAVDQALLSQLSDEKLAEVEKLADDPTVDASIVAAEIDAGVTDRSGTIQHALDEFSRLYLENIGGQDGGR